MGELKMKNRILIISAMSLGIFLCCLGIFLNMKNTDNLEKKTNLPSTDLGNSKPDLTVEEEGNLILKLTKYGKVMYEDGSYLQLNEAKDYYYITLGELKNKGYLEIENLVYNCKNNDPIIYFYKNTKDFEFYPIVVTYYCSWN